MPFEGERPAAAPFEHPRTDRHLRPRILHVINNLATGGAESMLIRLVTGLRGEFDQSVICVLDRGPLAADLEAANIPVRALGLSPRLPNPAGALTLARLMRGTRPDIVQTWLYQSDLMAGVSARIAGCRNVVWNLRGADLSPREAHPLTRGIVRICAALSGHLPVRIVCCAESVAEVHRRLGYDPRRMVVIFNGVDLARFRPDEQSRASVREELGLRSTTPLIGLIARLHPQKDHETFFAAARRLREVNRDVHFLLAGQRMHAREPEVAVMLRRHSLDEGFHFLGERRDIARICAALDFATSTSAWGEGFPNVLCEAMACGVPCVATDAGDSRLIVGDTGRIVARRDPAGLANAWMEMLTLDSDARRNLGIAARDRVERHFDQRVSTARYAQLYRELASAQT